MLSHISFVGHFETNTTKVMIVEFIYLLMAHPDWQCSEFHFLYKQPKNSINKNKKIQN